MDIGNSCLLPFVYFAQLLDEALKEMEYFCEKYKKIEELATVFASMQNARRKLKRNKVA